MFFIPPSASDVSFAAAASGRSTERTPSSACCRFLADVATSDCTFFWFCSELSQSAAVLVSLVNSGQYEMTDRLLEILNANP